MPPRAFIAAVVNSGFYMGKEPDFGVLDDFKNARRRSGGSSSSARLACQCRHG